MFIKDIILKIFIAMSLFAISWSSAYAKRAFIIDTDVNTDDQIAILHLLNQPDIDVKAITIASDGQAHCQPALYNVKTLLRLVKQTNIPVACGRDTPLKGNHHFPAWLRAKADVPKQAFKPVQYPRAVKLLHTTLNNSQQPVDILAIGPLTNLAELLIKYPDIKSKIRMIYLMGGAFHVPGNVNVVDPTQKNKVAEWNIYIDPVAADIVLRSHVPITLIPLDLTDQVPVDKNFYQKIKNHQQTELDRYIYEIYYRDENEIIKGTWYFWDAVAAVIASDESIARFKKQKLRIALSSEQLSGETILDNQRGYPVRVSTSLDIRQFKKRLLNK